MTYDDTISWLCALERRKGMDFRLERLGPVLDDLDHPEAAFAAIHVAGTNGKGSTAAMLHTIYGRAGYTVGLYTSPHLLSFCERIRVGNRCIAESDVVVHTERVCRAMRASGTELTFFEIATLVAFVEFREHALDLAVIEVGLGGRLDATNVVRSVACVITSIDLDHCDHLGNTLSEVAHEKAGILKPGVPLVTGPLAPEAETAVMSRVDAAGSRWLRYGEDFGANRVVGGVGVGGPGLLGAHQAENAGVAAAVVRLLQQRFPVAHADVDAGLAATRWPGRLEVIAGAPDLVLDGAHNAAAAARLAPALGAMELGRPRVLVFGVMADKDWREMLCRLAPIFDCVFLVPVDNQRSLDPVQALGVARSIVPRAHTAASAAAGLSVARRRAGARGAVVVTGSIFLVAELYRDCVGEEQLCADAC